MLSPFTLLIFSTLERKKKKGVMIMSSTYFREKVKRKSLAFTIISSALPSTTFSLQFPLAFLGKN